MAIRRQCVHYPFPGNGLNTGTLTITLPISLYYSTHEVFKSHTKSSLHRLTFKSELTCTQYSIPLLSFSYPGRLAPRAPLTQMTFRVLYNHSARTTAENTAPVLLPACIARCIATVFARTTETALLYFWSRVLRALLSNGSRRHNIIINF
jgi:hypothetical protein